MDSNKLKKETFLGVVVDNKDPFKVGRCKIKVFQVFDRLEVADIPWATPWKDLNGNEFTLPEVGKIVSVVFDQGNKYTPEYICAQNYNINLERKLRTLSDEDYTSMRAVLLDHSTQIYRNQTEGLKIDHEYTNINLDQYGNILMNLRDNKSIITLGSRDADEEIILGTTFMEWFDDFVSCLLGTEGGAYIDKTAAPVTAGPRLADTLLAYSRIRDKFLSKHVRASKNDFIIAQSREYINQKGDLENATREIPSPVPSSTIFNPSTGRQEGYKSSNKTTGNPAEQNENTDSDYEQEGITSSDISDPIKIGALPYSYSAVAKSLISRGFKNAELLEKGAELVSVATGNSRYGGNYLLHPAAASAFKAIRAAAKKAGLTLRVSSAYRDRDHQKSLGSGKGVAGVGSSPHGWAGALDFGDLYQAAGGSTSPSVNRKVRETNALGIWLNQVGPQYGWYNPWRLKDGKGVDECWHFEYWGNV